MKSAAALLCTLLAAPTLADPPVIKHVSATKNGATWRFDVTLSHEDTGWEDYADGWRVLDMDGKELGYRELLHPHVTEQPFTRSLSGVSVPKGAENVQIEARDSVGGWSGQTVTVRLR